MPLDTNFIQDLHSYYQIHVNRIHLFNNNLTIRSLKAAAYKVIIRTEQWLHNECGKPYAHDRPLVHLGSLFAATASL
jgi:hypothetical protein